MRDAADAANERRELAIVTQLLHKAGRNVMIESSMKISRKINVYRVCV